MSVNFGVLVVVNFLAGPRIRAPRCCCPNVVCSLTISGVQSATYPWLEGLSCCSGRICSVTYLIRSFEEIIGHDLFSIAPVFMLMIEGSRYPSERLDLTADDIYWEVVVIWEDG